MFQMRSVAQIDVLAHKFGHTVIDYSKEGKVEMCLIRHTMIVRTWSENNKRIV
jgi:Zn-dependent membrane protease YugP